MSVQTLRVQQRPATAPRLSVVERVGLPSARARAWSLARHLVAEGVVGPHALATVIHHATVDPQTLPRTLLALGLARDPALTEALARHAGLDMVDPLALPPDAALIDRLGAETCLRLGLLPWRRRGGVTQVLLAAPAQIEQRRDLLRAVFGPVRFALAPQGAIEAAIARCRAVELCRWAETRSPAGESCRGMARTGRALPLLCAAVALLAVLAPTALLLLATVCAALGMLATMALNAAALLAALRHPLPAPPARGAPLPTVSIIVALFHEADIAPRLVQRLGRIDYPRDRLDVILALEEDDHETRAALLRTHLPAWMRLVTLPRGAVKTKPRALNYALPFCRGSIIGVYDAEDAPATGQLRDVVRHFDACDPQVACLQGVLDFYNPTQSWLTRAFTVDYAVWFRVILPGLSRLRLPVPLGGTTLFFRRAALEKLGGWDAHNVTEDADLGIRLIRHGFRTEVIASVTTEEATCRAYPWVRQRSRWMKGYLMTWRVHMRRPGQLWRDLGPRGFIAFNVLFLGGIAQAALFPVVVLLWATSLGLAHPVLTVLPFGATLALIGLGLLSEAIRLTLAIIGLRSRRRPLPLACALLPHLVQPLASLAAYRAFWELIRRPFYWDKTQHGLCDTQAT